MHVKEDVTQDQSSELFLRSEMAEKRTVFYDI